MRNHHRSLAALLLALTTAAGCATAARGGGPLPAGDSYMVHVENQSVCHVNVYALLGQTRVMLGRVDMMRNRSFAVPAGLFQGGTVRLAAARPGSRHELVSEPLWLASGQQVNWRLMDSPGIATGPGWGMVSFTSVPRRPY
ncbi:hypothetical protein BH23GEM7_BH23GEM7_30340 [soil metagenome]